MTRRRCSLNNNRHDRAGLLQLQSLDLAAKVQLSRQRIRAWLEHTGGNAYVAFSAGLDSTVLGDLARSVDEEIPFVFHDSVMEFPENRRFARESGAIFTKSKYGPQEVFERYGYPVTSKKIAQYVHECRTAGPDSVTYRLRTTGWTKRGRYTQMSMIPKKWQFLIDAPFPISDKCCAVFKKRPAHAYQKQTGRLPLLGVRVEESNQRLQTWYRYGCQYPGKRSWPIAFWSGADVLAYIRANSLPYSPLYDMGYTRSGCAFCLFGCHKEKPNRIQRLYETHPALWRYCMDKCGLRRVMDWLKLPTEPERMLF